MESREGGEFRERGDAREGGVICEAREAGEACCKVCEVVGDAHEEGGEGEDVVSPDGMGDP